MRKSFTDKNFFYLKNVNHGFFHDRLLFRFSKKVSSYMLELIVVPTIENGEQLCIRLCRSCFFFFLFVFHAKSAAANTHRRKLGVIKALSVLG